MIIIFTNLSLRSYYFLQAFYSNFLIAIAILSAVILITLIAYTLSWREYTKLNEKHTTIFDKVWEEVRAKEKEIDNPGKTE